MSRNVTDASDGFLTGKRFLIHDRDPLFTVAFGETLAAAGVQVVRLPARSPNLNAYAERFVRTIKESCLDRLILVGEGSLRRAVAEFIEHYHRERNHQGLGNQLIVPLPARAIGDGRILSRELWFARIRAGAPRVDPPCHERHNRGVLNMVALLIRAVGLACRGHHELVLENLALRQQLHALKRTTSRPQLRTRDRLFWVILARTWRNWRTALVLVRPDTVVRWHREWLRRRWTRQSARNRVGRPCTDAAIRRLVRAMTDANPLWGAPRIHGELGKVGIEVSERTVSRLLGRPRLVRHHRRGGPS